MSQDVDVTPSHNGTTGLSAPVAYAPHQYYPPPSPNATNFSPYPQQNFNPNGSGQPSYAAVVAQRAVQQPKQAPLSTGMRAVQQSNMPAPAPALRAPDANARQEYYQQYLASHSNRSPTWAQVVRRSPTMQAQSMNTPQPEPSMRTHPNCTSMTSTMPFERAADTASTAPIITEDMWAMKNFSPGVAEPFGSIANWTEQSRAADDRIRPRRDTRLSDRGPDGVADRPFLVSPPSSISRSSTRRTRDQMIAGEHDHICGVCGSGFDTWADLNHHARCHKRYEDRAHRCSVCSTRFTYAKDLRRHEPIHGPQKFFCPHHFCKSATTGFKREDHLQRHMRSQHPDSVMQSSGPSSQRGP